VCPGTGPDAVPVAANTGSAVNGTVNINGTDSELDACSGHYYCEKDGVKTWSTNDEIDAPRKETDIHCYSCDIDTGLLIKNLTNGTKDPGYICKQTCVLGNILYDDNGTIEPNTVTGCYGCVNGSCVALNGNPPYDQNFNGVPTSQATCTTTCSRNYLDTLFDVVHPLKTDQWSFRNSVGEVMFFRLNWESTDGIGTNVGFPTTLLADDAPHYVNNTWGLQSITTNSDSTYLYFVAQFVSPLLINGVQITNGRLNLVVRQDRQTPPALTFSIIFGWQDKSQIAASEFNCCQSTWISYETISFTSDVRLSKLDFSNKFLIKNNNISNTLYDYTTLNTGSNAFPGSWNLTRVGVIIPAPGTFNLRTGSSQNSSPTNPDSDDRMIFRNYDDLNKSRPIRKPINLKDHTSTKSFVPAELESYLVTNPNNLQINESAPVQTNIRWGMQSVKRVLVSPYLYTVVQFQLPQFHFQDSLTINFVTRHSLTDRTKARMTGDVIYYSTPLFHFVCAWVEQNNCIEYFPPSTGNDKCSSPLTNAQQVRVFDSISYGTTTPQWYFLYKTSMNFNTGEVDITENLPSAPKLFNLGNVKINVNANATNIGNSLDSSLYLNNTAYTQIYTALATNIIMTLQYRKLTTYPILANFTLSGLSIPPPEFNSLHPLKTDQWSFRSQTQTEHMFFRLNWDSEESRFANVPTGFTAVDMPHYVNNEWGLKSVQSVTDTMHIYIVSQFASPDFEANIGVLNVVVRQNVFDKSISYRFLMGWKQWHTFSKFTCVESEWLTPLTFNFQTMTNLVLTNTRLSSTFPNTLYDITVLFGPSVDTATTRFMFVRVPVIIPDPDQRFTLSSGNIDHATWTTDDLNSIDLNDNWSQQQFVPLTLWSNLTTANSPASDDDAPTQSNIYYAMQSVVRTYDSTYLYTIVQFQSPQFYNQDSVTYNYITRQRLSSRTKALITSNVVYAEPVEYHILVSWIETNNYKFAPELMTTPDTYRYRVYDMVERQYGVETGLPLWKPILLSTHLDISTGYHLIALSTAVVTLPLGLQTLNTNVSGQPEHDPKQSQSYLKNDIMYADYYQNKPSQPKLLTLKVTASV
jgi:hypothetical protein